MDRGVESVQGKLPVPHASSRSANGPLRFRTIYRGPRLGLHGGLGRTLPWPKANAMDVVLIFPQVEGLGHSATAHHYAIRAREEAAGYIAHPHLSARLLNVPNLS